MFGLLEAPALDARLSTSMRSATSHPAVERCIILAGDGVERRSVDAACNRLADRRRYRVLNKSVPACSSFQPLAGYQAEKIPASLTR
jgi:hypothetical protein